MAPQTKPAHCFWWPIDCIDKLNFQLFPLRKSAFWEGATVSVLNISSVGLNGNVYRSPQIASGPPLPKPRRSTSGFLFCQVVAAGPLGDVGTTDCAPMHAPGRMNIQHVQSGVIFLYQQIDLRKITSRSVVHRTEYHLSVNQVCFPQQLKYGMI